MLRFSTLLIYLFSLSVYATQLPVIAIDYPPFTSEKDEGNGIAFSLLTDAMDGSSLTIMPQYWSPARAHKLVKEGSWCSSFYPPRKDDEQFVIVALADEPIELGLYRHHQVTPFRWNSLVEMEGKTVAYLRALSRDGLGKHMTESGMVIFSVETIEQGMQLLSRGRVDYAFGDQISGEIIMRSLNMDPDEYQFSLTHFRTLPVGIWLNLSCKAAVSALQHLQSKGFKQLEQEE
ncbi:hypothetical protein [Shewanella sp. UCD-KL12]|uniref:hypothetical protein n=1 Tax=Shewanella sp. UCD-KL12 TaxID=1917163 RepID=UPI000970E38E|nr:hypothetical protein [Shewanella sp. UCD-KL12]